MHRCSLCLESALPPLLNRSLYCRYSAHEGMEREAVDRILSREKSAYLKYIEVIIEAGRHECMIDYQDRQRFKQEIREAVEYYKYRVYVPVFAKSKLADNIVTYYYSKLKNHYNNIKRNLHITVDITPTKLFSSQPSSQSSFDFSLLRELKQEIHGRKDNLQLSGLDFYKSQSKALEDLVNEMKQNRKFELVNTLTTDDCFREQHIFERTSEIAKKERKYYYEARKVIIKTKDGKKTIGCNPRKAVLERKEGREAAISQGKTVKTARVADQKGYTLRSKINSVQNSPYKAKQSSQSNKDDNNLLKKYASLDRLHRKNSSSLASPLKKPPQTVSKSKKASSTAMLPKHQSLPKDNPPASPFKSTQIKQSMLKIKAFQLQNRDKPFPSSSSKKTTLQNQTIYNNEDIYTLRRKRLQKLQLKTKK